MGIYSIKPKFQKFLKPVENLFVKWEVHPTIINFLALFLSIAAGFVLFYAEKYPMWLIYIPIMAFVRTALNALDGLVARRLKVKNQNFGEVLNEFLDRLSDAIIFLGLAFASYTNVILGTTVTVLILLNSYLGIVNKAAGGSRIYKGLIGKADRMIYLGIMAVIILIWNNWNFANYTLYFIGIGMIISIIQRLIIVKKELYKWSYKHE
jgi:CDP-diacylglycerol---glycerol-3-phosphate 3-phosphatidyltransferase